MYVITTTGVQIIVLEFLEYRGIKSQLYFAHVYYEEKKKGN